MNKYKIGVTVILKNGESFFENGIKQNCIMLAKLLMISGHDVTLVNFANENQLEEFKFGDIEYKLINVNKSFEEVSNLDILIHVSTIPNKSETLYFKSKNPNLKVISYKCGNNYVNDMEDILFKSRPTNENYITYDDSVDGIWYVPQQQFNNHDYYSILNRVSSKAIPFVWDPMFIQEHINVTPDCFYKPNGLRGKDISVFEPNINIVKYSVPSILAIEHANRLEPDYINNVRITNTKQIMEVNLFVGMMNQLDIVKQQKASFNSRYPIVYYLKEKTDIVVSHQWANPLNYLYLDVLYMGYPLVHNADLLKDLGYYYKDFNLKDAGELILKVAKEYDNDYEAIRKKNLKIIQRYIPTNTKLQEQYNLLLDSLFDEELEKSKSWELNWKKNTYK